jgi:monomeric isocitrate dehydrogenase
MSSDEPPLSAEEAVFDSLDDDGESPWVLHAELIRVYELADVGIEEVLAILTRFHERGWVVPDHPNDPSPDFWKKATAAYADWLGAGYRRNSSSYFMDYGPWYELTADGRQELARRRASQIT